MTDGQLGALVTAGTMVLGAGVVTLLDWWAQRRQDRSEDSKAR